METEKLPHLLFVTRVNRTSVDVGGEEVSRDEYPAKRSLGSFQVLRLRSSWTIDQRHP